MRKVMTMTLLACLIVMTATIIFAREGGDSGGLLAGVEAATAQNWNSANPVWETGTIDAISAEGMFINDIRYRLTDGTHFFSDDGIIMKMSDFGQGTEVTFVLGSDRKTIVTLIKGIVQEETKE